MGRLDKRDWLAEMQGLVGVVLGVLVVTALLGVVDLVAGGGVVARVPVDAVTGLTDASGGLRPGVRVDDAGSVDVVVAEPTAGQLVASALTGLPTHLVAIAVFALLFVALRRARREDPFLPATVRRLRIAALVAIVAGPLAFVVETIATMDLTSRVTDGTIAAAAELGTVGLWLLAGFGLLAVAEIVNRGRALRAELDTVI
jgi:Protein of unknown function (DUF2975)